jgi:hypothetical protein
MKNDTRCGNCFLGIQDPRKDIPIMKTHPKLKD